MKTFPLSLAFLSTALAFSPPSGPKTTSKTEHKSAATANVDDRPLYDPLGLYPQDAPERTSGRLVPLETYERYDDSVTDPMNLYQTGSVDVSPRSRSLPFLKQPAMLDGTLPGDRGFDPFNFAGDATSLEWQRTAEIKHARLAMLAAAGWPLAELFDKQIANALDLKPLLVFQDRVPSVLNGGLDRISPFYWAGILTLAAAIEGYSFLQNNEQHPGDLGFDPLGLFGKTEQQQHVQLESELFNGRLAMLAITGFAVQEWVTQNAIVNQFPIFFKPINVALEQLMDAGANAM